jgi:hypothetical protein
MLINIASAVKNFHILDLREVPEDLTGKGKEIGRDEIMLFIRRDETYSTQSTTSPVIKSVK